MRKLLSLRFLVFLALLPVALLLFWEGRKLPMKLPQRGGITFTDFYEYGDHVMVDGRCRTV